MADKLAGAVAELLNWQAEEDRAGRTRNSRCLEAVRHSLRRVELALPISGVDYPGMFAVDCGRTLAENPGRWKWQRIHSPLPEYSLVFFRKCGFIPRRLKFAGHIAILANGKLYANVTYDWGPYWAKRIDSAFIPAG